MDGQLKTLIELQTLDTRIAGLEAEAAKLPQEIARVRAAVDEARREVEGARGRVDAARKATRAREKDLEDTQVKRQKYEAQLYQVKTNKEYSAVLTEIEEVKQQKGRIEEEILTLMERQERLAAEIKDAEGRLVAAERQGAAEEQSLRDKLAAVEADLALVRADRAGVARDLPAPVMADYERLLRARGGLALTPVTLPNLCSGCRMTITPQRLQELKQQNALIACESCGRYLYWSA
jgi:predicted  nucleic acid-binding Zn-ribbon protein